MAKNSSKIVQSSADLPAREVYRFKIPRVVVVDEDTKERTETEASRIPGVESMGIVELTPNEEKTAAIRAGDQPNALGFEIIKIALVEYNGKPVRLSDGSLEKALFDMGPKGRQLLMTAYTDLTGMDDDLITDFKASRTSVA